MTTPILDHEGKKYLRDIFSPLSGESIKVDVYEVLEAFGLDGGQHAIGHAVKKLLCAGQRGKGDRLADLKGAIAALNRAVELEERRQVRDNARVIHVNRTHTFDAFVCVRCGKSRREVTIECSTKGYTTCADEDPKSKETWSEFLSTVQGTRRPPNGSQEPAGVVEDLAPGHVGDQPAEVPAGGRDGAGAGDLRQGTTEGPGEAEGTADSHANVSFETLAANPPWGPVPASGREHKVPKRDYDLGGGGGGD